MSSSGLDSVKYEQLQSFIMTGKTGDLPDDMVVYLSHLELVRSLNDKYESKTAILRVLKSPVYGYSDYAARKIYAEALNFFYSDNSVKREAWANIYADKLDNLALLAIESDDWESARRCFLDAAKIRMGSDDTNTIPAELLERRPVFYTLNPEDVGLPNKVNRHKLARWIDSLPDIDSDSRNRIHRDAMSPKAEGNILDIEEKDIEYLGDQNEQEEH